MDSHQRRMFRRMVERQKKTTDYPEPIPMREVTNLSSKKAKPWTTERVISILGLAGMLLIPLLQWDGVLIVRWELSIIGYLCVMAITLIAIWKWEGAAQWGEGKKILVLTAILLSLVAISSFGTFTEYRREHPLLHPGAQTTVAALRVAVTPQITVFSPTRDKGSRFWVAYTEYKDGETTIQGRFVSPVNAVVYLKVENESDEPVMIANLDVEMPTNQGRWLHVIRIDSRMVTVFIMNIENDFSKAFNIKTDLLDAPLFSQELQPHKPLLGAILLAYPSEMKPEEQFVGQFKIRLTDTKGAV